MEETWKRREYETWDEAFRGLAPAVRQQSVRVAAYTQALFVQACSGPFGKDTREGSEEMRGAYADLAYKCGMYHQIGKALVPPEYQVWQPDFTEEERAVYRKYTADGRALATALQEGGGREKRRETKNIPWRMIRESCEQHMERWDGSGYPAGRKGPTISPIAQIVGIAKELDRLVSQTRSETPFEDAYRTLVAQSGEEWSPALITVLEQAKEKCRAVYEKYIHYTLTLPMTVPLVLKRKDRPMGLKYRPMVSGIDGDVTGYEAIPWFAGLPDGSEDTEGVADIEEMLRRNDLIADVSFYLLYEAADALLRVENCKIPCSGVLVDMMPAFYTLESQLERLDQLYRDQPIPKEKLLLTIPMDFLMSLDMARADMLRRYTRHGVRLAAEGYDPGKLPPEKLRDLGITALRPDPALYLKDSSVSAIRSLQEAGFTVLAGGADSYDVLSWLSELGLSGISGTMTGLCVNEDDLIRDGLNRQR